MPETLIYKTSYFDDKFSIFNEKNLWLLLYKSSWIGWSEDVFIDENKYRFTRKGIWHPQIIITDKLSGNEVATTQVKFPFFGFNPTAVTHFKSGNIYNWNSKGILNYNWSWQENNSVIITSTEKNHLFTISGEINITKENEVSKLLSVLGLYLRISIYRQNKIGIIIGLVIASAIIYRWLLG
jgi:hypothetical protein